MNIDQSKKINVNGKDILIFEVGEENIDLDTVASFGEEWEKFDSFSHEEISNVGQEYFDIVDFEKLNTIEMTALDAGCGTGRWSVYLASKFKTIYAIDPSKAVLSAANLTKDIENIKLIQCSIDNVPFNKEYFDFVFSLGVLHHIPNTQKALNSIVNLVKPDGYCLIYLYYNLDNRGIFYKFLFFISSLLRRLVSSLPKRSKKIFCDFLAFSVYIPLIYLSKLAFLFFGDQLASKIPLNYYRKKSLNIIRNDSLDRFGTPLEQRFSRDEIKKMMEKSGLTDIVFSEKEPYWHAFGRKK